MSTSYPGELDDYTGQIGTGDDPPNDPPHDVHHQNIADAMEAVQAELGTTPSGSAATVGARIGDLEGDLAAHEADSGNPHDVTAAQAGAAPNPHGNEAHSPPFLEGTDSGNVLGGSRSGGDQETQVAVGPAASTSGTGAIAMGDGAASEAGFGVAIGQGASVTTGVAVGWGAAAAGAFATALGQNAEASAGSAAGLGRGTDAGHASATAVGRNAASTAANQGVLGGTGGNATNDWVVPGDFTVNGSKNFSVTNPANPGEDIRHGAYEGPVPGGTVYRYTVEVKDGSVEHELPDYFDALNTGPQVWCQADRHFGIAYGEIEGNTLTVHANTDGNYHILILATRNDPAVHGWYDRGERKPKGITWTGETEDIVERNEAGDIETVYRAPSERTQTQRTPGHMHHRRVHVGDDMVRLSREESPPSDRAQDVRGKAQAKRRAESVISTGETRA